MADQYVLSVDQGTSSTKAMALSSQGHILATATMSLSHTTPRPGWVEQDPREIMSSVVTCLQQVQDEVGRGAVSIGLSSQRESALAWDAETRRPLSPLLGWQDRRTTDAASRLSGDGVGERVRELSGLPLDPMFSALKLSWILDEIDQDRRRAKSGNIRLGTVDAWLLDSLTGEFRIEAGNASRTQLLNIDTLDWDQELLSIFRIPVEALPKVHRSDSPSAPVAFLDGGLGFGGILGDSHAALFGHGVREPGSVKTTYGTGSSVMGLTNTTVPGSTGMVHTLGWLRDKPARAFEGNILSTGATLMWLAKVLGTTPTELDEWSRTVDSSNGVVLVPAFAGLGAPYWDPHASAVICGFDQGTTRAHLARAAFDSIAHQITDTLERADEAAGQRIELILADGGPSRNDWLMQLQADLSRRLVKRPTNEALSATGAAHLAGLTAGLWDDQGLAAIPSVSTDFTPSGSDPQIRERRHQWALAVTRARLRATTKKEGTSHDNVVKHFY